MTKNYCIIMAGGVGSRFWPVSTNSRPKQFIDFMGTGRSLLRMTVDRLSDIIPIRNILIVTNHLYKSTILQQIPELAPSQILLEPLRRNTAPCIAYAAYRIMQTEPEANILVVPSDHLIVNEKEFSRVIKEGLDFVAGHEALLTIGIKPTRPETGYGYIQVENGNSALRKVKTFTEKPDSQMAELFLSSGEFYWNSGMFMWRADVIIDAIKKHLPEVAEKFESGKEFFYTEHEQSFIDKIYPQCQNISIDYGVMEKSHNVYVILADFGWSDLGTWSSLHELSLKDDNNNVSLPHKTLFYNAKDNLIALPSDEVAVIDGLEGYLVARANGVLLICPRKDEKRMRQYVQDAADELGEKYI